MFTELPKCELIVTWRGPTRLGTKRHDCLCHRFVRGTYLVPQKCKKPPNEFELSNLPAMTSLGLGAQLDNDDMNPPELYQPYCPIVLEPALVQSVIGNLINNVLRGPQRGRASDYLRYHSSRLLASYP